MNRYQPSCRQLLKSTLTSYPLLPESQVSLHGSLLGILHVGLTILMETNCLLPAYCSTFSAQDQLSSQVDLFLSKRQTFQPPSKVYFSSRRSMIAFLILLIIYSLDTVCVFFLFSFSLSCRACSGENNLLTHLGLLLRSKHTASVKDGAYFSTHFYTLM